MILGQFLTLENMVEKFFQNSNFSDFLGIKSEISQYFQIWTLGGALESLVAFLQSLDVCF